MLTDKGLWTLVLGGVSSLQRDTGANVSEISGQVKKSKESWKVEKLYEMGMWSRTGEGQ